MSETGPGTIHQNSSTYLLPAGDNSSFNTLRSSPNGRHFETFSNVFFYKNVYIWIKISLNFVSKVPINNNILLVQIMVWRRPGDKPLSEPMMVSLPMHICVTRPQWVKRASIQTVIFLSNISVWSSYMQYVPWNMHTAVACIVFWSSYMQYVPWNMHTAVVCSVFWSSYMQYVSWNLCTAVWHIES